MMPLTAAECRVHPAFSNVIWDLKPRLKGRCPVAADRGGPYKIAYEIHGHGPIKILVRITNSNFTLEYFVLFY